MTDEDYFMPFQYQQILAMGDTWSVSSKWPAFENLSYPKNNEDGV
jgi:hypothetical protein